MEEESKVKKTIRYSEAFKKQVVDEIARGKFASPHQASKGYGIRGADTVRQWLRKYGRDDLFPKRIRIETMKERDELKDAKKRIRDLESALVNAHMDSHLEHAFLEIACERLGIQPEDLKKKSGLTLSGVLKYRGARKT